MSRGASPSADSRKMPAVFVGIGPTAPTSLTKDTRDQIESSLGSFFGVFSPQESRDDQGKYVFHKYVEDGTSKKPSIGLLSWQSVLEFSFEAGTESMYTATIRIWDPTYELLDTMAAMRENSPGTNSVFFRFGWIEDGTSKSLSPLYESVVVALTPECLADGMMLTLYCQSGPTHNLMVQKANASFDENIPFHKVIQVLLESPPLDLAGESSKHFTVADVDAFIAKANANPNRVPRLQVYTELEPLRNNGQPLIIGFSDSPLVWIKHRLEQGGLAADTNKQGRVPILLESARNPGVYILGVEGAVGSPQDQSALPEYHVGRGAQGNVLAFTPQNMGDFANQIGGFGRSRGIDASQSGKQQVVDSGMPFALPDWLYKSNMFTPDSLQNIFQQQSKNNAPRYSAPSFARNTETLSQQRRALWNNSRILAVDARLDILGNPFTDIGDYIQVFTYSGGTLSTLGRYKDTLDDRTQDTPSVYAGLSGLWFVMGFVHHIAGGRFVTAISLLRSTTTFSVKEKPQQSSEDQSIAEPTMSKHVVEQEP